MIDDCPASSGKFIGSPSLLILTNGDYNRRQPIAGFWPTFLMMVPGTASRYSRTCLNKEGLSLINPNASTHGPPTSSARPREPRASAADHRRNPANRVRSATASGSKNRACQPPVILSMSSPDPGCPNLSTVGFPQINSWIGRQQNDQNFPLALVRLANAVFPCVDQSRCNTHFRCQLMR